MKTFLIVILALLSTHTFVFSQSTTLCEYTKRYHLLEAHLPYDHNPNCPSCNQTDYSDIAKSRSTSNLIDIVWAEHYEQNVQYPDSSDWLYNVYQCNLPDVIPFSEARLNRAYTSPSLSYCTPTIDIEEDSISLFQISVDSEFADGGTMDSLTLNVEINLMGDEPAGLLFNAYLVKKDNSYGFFSPPYSSAQVCNSSYDESIVKNLVIDEFNPGGVASFIDSDQIGTYNETYTLLIPDGLDLNEYKIVSILYNGRIQNALESEILVPSTTGYYNLDYIDECVFANRKMVVEKIMSYDIWGDHDCCCNESNYSVMLDIRTIPNVLDLTWAEVYDPTGADFGQGVWQYNVFQCEPHHSYDDLFPAFNRAFPGYWNHFIDYGGCYSYSPIHIDLSVEFDSINEILSADIEVENLFPTTDSLFTVLYAVRKTNVYNFFSPTDPTCSIVVEADDAKNFVIDELMPIGAGSSYLEFDANDIASQSLSLASTTNFDNDFYVVAMVYNNDEVLNALDCEINAIASSGYFNCADSTSIDSTVSIIHYQEEQLWSVYQDLANNRMIIESSLDSDLLLFSAEGKIVKRIESGNRNISLKDLPAGVFILI